jgi:hypothetical protein
MKVIITAAIKDKNKVSLTILKNPESQFSLDMNIDQYKSCIKGIIKPKVIGKKHIAIIKILFFFERIL